MKRNLMTFTAVLAILVGGFIVARGQSNSTNAPANPNANTNPNPKPNFAAGPNGPRLSPGHRFPFRSLSGDHPFMFDKFTEKLNLTPEQKAQIQPIIEQAKPQLEQIREEAMQKSKAVIEGTVGQVRAMLTPEQQAKFDEMKEAHERARRSFQSQGNGDDSN